MSVAIVISQPGGPDVLKAIEMTQNEPGPDEVQIQHEVCLLYTSPSPRDA